MTPVVRLDRRGRVAVIAIDSPPVNAGSHAVRSELLATIRQVDGDPAIDVVLLKGEARNFMAGSDLREFDLPLQDPQLPAVIAAIEASSKPFIALLHGAALGGGLELALGCDHRLASTDAVVGLPECTLGMLPGAGGTQRLPRLTGAAVAMELVCTGRRVGADEALRLGIVNGVIAGDLLDAGMALAESGVSKSRVLELPLPDGDLDVETAVAESLLKKLGSRPHILAALENVRAAGHVEAKQGLATERSAFQRLRVAPEAKALRHLFFAQNEAGQRRSAIAVSAPRKVGVIGAGTMGTTIALALLMARTPVVLIEQNEVVLGRGLETIASSLDRMLAKGQLTQDEAKAASTALQSGTALADLAGCEFVIEAIVENIDAKRAVFAELDRLLAPGAILASNTSYLDIDEITSATDRPERVLGMHFFSPAHLMPLVEIIGGKSSDDGAVDTGLLLARRLGKHPVVAGNGFGFIGNRIYSAYRSACEYMVEDGALPFEVDDALEAFGFAMGIFSVADMSGLDIAWRMRQQRAAQGKLPGRYVPIPDRLCERGWFGRKSGRGYYAYADGKARRRDPEVERLIAGWSAEEGRKPQRRDATAIQRLALAAMVNEAAIVLEENIASRPGDIDVVMVHGYGFPRWLGGPVHWARQQDQARLEQDCRNFVAMSEGAYRLGGLTQLRLV